MAKVCITCKIIKDHDKFYYRSDKPHLLQSTCKECLKAKRRNDYINNKEKKKKRDKEYHLKNRSKRLNYNKAYNKRTRNKRALKDKERYSEDINFRMRQNIANRIRMALKRNSKKSTTLELLGCDIPFLKYHLECQFLTGMTWDNYGEWQIDHIMPCSKFDLSKIEAQNKCFHYSNLQPLWHLDNRQKSNRVIEKEVCHR